jgi:hypothetical protein
MPLTVAVAKVTFATFPGLKAIVCYLPLFSVAIQGNKKGTP